MRFYLLAFLVSACVLADSGDLAAQRRRMVETQLRDRGISDQQVLAAMLKVPREEFVPPSLRALAYDDRPLPIGEGQTISQPYVVALMTELAALRPGARVLEVGTGSGYQAAVLAAIGCEVYSIEIVESLAASSAERLKRLGYRSVRVRHGDGYRGWPEHAPFDAILVTAAPETIPKPLEDQLAAGGRLVAPVGATPWTQQLVVETRGPAGLTRRSVAGVAFVPMTGEATREGASK